MLISEYEKNLSINKISIAILSVLSEVGSITITIYNRNIS